MVCYLHSSIIAFQEIIPIGMVSAFQPIQKIIQFHTLIPYGMVSAFQHHTIPRNHTTWYGICISASYHSRKPYHMVWYGMVSVFQPFQTIIPHGMVSAFQHHTDTRCTGMNMKVRKTRNKDQVPREKP